MIPFEPILAAAEARVGAETVAARLPTPKSADDLIAVPDDRYLSLISLRVFSTGLKHSMVRDKWPAFEEVFQGFAPKPLRAMSDEALEGLMAEKRIIRHWGKIKSVRTNAAAICRIADEAGSFGAWLAYWPGDRIVELWDQLAKHFTQLGGSSGPYFLRMAGKDTFTLSGDVVRALNHFGAYEGTPKGKKDTARVQEIFNEWAAATGRPLSHLSMILALSTD